MNLDDNVWRAVSTCGVGFGKYKTTDFNKGNEQGAIFVSDQLTRQSTSSAIIAICLSGQITSIPVQLWSAKIPFKNVFSNIKIFLSYTIWK